MSDPLPIRLDPLPGSTMSDEAILLRLRDRLDRVAWPVSLRLNHNRRTLISLRGSPRRGMRLSIHAALLGYPAAVEELPGWISTNGRPTGPGIRHALADLGRSLREHERAQRPSLVLEPLGGPLDLDAQLDRIHGQHFSELPRPDITWGRSRTRLPRRQVRFATYRPRPRPLVTVSPRLDQPWIARLFIDFVLYHELCHHAQANAPLRGERVHGKRFRAWERRFPGFDQATRWERENLDRFLG